jgi:hypothetical protein
MTSKILTSATAFAFATTAGLATTAPASAHHPYWTPGNAATDAAEDLVGGAAEVAGNLVGGALATTTWLFGPRYSGYYQAYSYSPSYAYEPVYAYEPRYGYGYGRYGRYHRGYYGYSGHRRCFQSCPER